MRAALAVVMGVGLGGCAEVEPLKVRTAASPEVRQIEVGTGTNAYVVMGARPILVDTGWGASTSKLEKGLAALGVKVTDLTLIIVTHGHGDHAGGAKRMRELSGAKVLAGQGDVTMIEAGKNRPLKPMGFLGKLIKGTSDKPFPGFTPDIAITDEYDLRPYGVEGKVVPMRGHTPGSVAVILKTGEAIVGDLLRGGIIATHSPNRHFYHDNCRMAEAHIPTLVIEGSMKLWVGHGGPIDGVEAKKEFQVDTCPKEEEEKKK